ncbi:MAG: hypothetical protein WD751_01160 [Anaerolineales bacterium]
MAAVSVALSARLERGDPVRLRAAAPPWSRWRLHKAEAQTPA